MSNKSTGKKRDWEQSIKCSVACVTWRFFKRGNRDNNPKVARSLGDRQLEATCSADRVDGDEGLSSKGIPLKLFLDMVPVLLRIMLPRALGFVVQ